MAKELTKDPALSLFASWGMAAGLVLGGWAARQVSRRPSASALTVSFGRDGVEVDVWFRKASNEPKFTRVGELDLSHSQTSPELSRAVGDFLRVVARWLEPHDTRALALALEVEQTAPTSASHAYDAGEAPPLDPSKETSASSPFMRFETIDVSDVGRFPDALREMYLGTLGGLVIKNVYDKATMARIVGSLASERTNFPRTSFPARFNAHFCGRALDGADPELDEYLRDAARFREETVKLYQGAVPFEERMEQMFSALAGGRSVVLPRYSDGRPYTPATIRILLENGQIGTHCGNEAATRPAYTHLNGIIDRTDQLSYFLTLQEPERGGELIVYSLKWSDIDRSHIVNGRSSVEALLGTAQWMAVAPTAGDLLLFDGGRYFHRVDVVRGPRLRWTMGGFMMFDQSGKQLLYWS